MRTWCGHEARSNAKGGPGFLRRPPLTCCFAFVAGAVCWLRTSEWGVSRHRNRRVAGHRNGCGSSRPAMSNCRSVAWSSPPSSPDQPSPRSPAPTGCPRAGSAADGPLPQPRARRPSSPAPARPKTSPSATLGRDASSWCCGSRKQLADAGLDAGADTIGWHLAHHHQITAVPGHDQPDPDPRRHRSPRTRRSDPSPPTSGSKPSSPTRPGSPTSPTTGSPAPTAARHRLEIITWLDDHSRYALHISAHARITAPIVLRHLPTQPLTCTDTPHPRSPTTAWSTPSGSPAAAGGTDRLEARAPPPRHRPEELPTQPPHHLRQGRALPADPEEVAARPARPADHDRRTADPARPVPRGVQPPPPAPLPAPPGHPGHRLQRPPQGHPRHRPRPPTPTTGSATTRSARPAPSPCASPAACATSASAEPTPEPTSSCSSKTSTSASSTPPPANSSASSPSTPRRDYQPTGRPPGPTRQRTQPGPTIRRSGLFRCLETSHCSGGRI